jgi:hypothetical protein
MIREVLNRFKNNTVTNPRNSPKKRFPSDRKRSKDPPAERVALSLPLKGEENASCPQRGRGRELINSLRLQNVNLLMVWVNQIL